MFLITSFLKSPSGGYFSINTRSVHYLSHHDLSVEYFFGMIFRLGTRVSSIFKPLARSLFSTQSNICNGAIGQRKVGPKWRIFFAGDENLVRRIFKPGFLADKVLFAPFMGMFFAPLKLNVYFHVLTYDRGVWVMLMIKDGGISWISCP